MKTSPFVHVLLFECRRCGLPLAVPITSEGRNSEGIDALELTLKCDCGWNTATVGFRARRGLVVDWDLPANRGSSISFGSENQPTEC